MKYQIRSAAAILSIVLLGGCATGRSVLDIPTQTAEKVVASNGKDVYINPAVDKRAFQAKPSSPDIPSLDPNGDQSDKIKARAIGRKRNTYGMALGDILLSENQSIESLTHASIRQAFIENGYRIVDNKSQINSNTYIVDADINKFWSWMNPGFWALTLSTEISTGLTIKSPSGVSKQNVAVKASDNFQTGAEGNWIEVMNKALKAYVEDLKTKVK